jgi:hypothetical protein
VGPALLVDGRYGVRRGWLVLTTRFLTWLPLQQGTTGTARAVTVPIHEVRRAPSPANELRIGHPEPSLRLIPGLGEPFVQAFWVAVEQCRFRRSAAAKAENRRDTYRVWIPKKMSRTVTVEYRVESGEVTAMEARLIDLSLGGCALITDRPLSGVSQMRLRVPLVPDDFEEPSDDPDLTAEIPVRPPDFIVLAYAVHERTLPDGKRWRCGLTFGKLRGHQQERARAAWMSFQREEVGVQSPWPNPEEVPSIVDSSITDSGEFII